MTDWEPALESLDDALGIADLILLSSLCAIVWLICAPVGIYARFAQRSGGDPLGEEADFHGAIEGGQTFHGEVI